MGPILQERTAATTLKRVSVKDKLREKNSENTATVTSSKRAGRVNQNNRPQKKTGSAHKNVIPTSDKDVLTKTDTRFNQSGNRQKNVNSPTSVCCKLRSSQGEICLKPQRPPPCQVARGEERQVREAPSLCCSEVDRCHEARERSRRALSLPLAPHPAPHQAHPHKQALDLESLRLIEHKEDDTDSASDLSDSERLPVLPSPCTPPQLNLRAEDVDSMDLYPQILAQMTFEEDDAYAYSDFLPPPFNTWSLRQLAIFLNTEGKRAPRPKPVGHLEKYLERLLQLEWHQIQTIQTERGGRGFTGALRARGPAPYAVANASHSRPHTAPPTRLSSPKSLQQSQRAFPLSVSPSPAGPPAAQPSRPLCPHCHIRYPLCNGSCSSSYAYQRHSRLSPLLERRAPPTGAPQKRSSSESRVGRSGAAADRGGGHPISPQTSGTHRGGGQQHPSSPQTSGTHHRRMQANGNIRRPSHDSGGNANSKSQLTSRRGRAAGGEADGQREAQVRRSAALERCPPSTKREAAPAKRAGKQCSRMEAAGGVTKAGAKRMVTDSRATQANNRPNGKVKNVQFAK